MKTYGCACCHRRRSERLGPVILCGVPLGGGREAVLRFCPVCQRKYAPEPPPIALAGLPADVIEAVESFDLPRRP